MLSVRLMVVVQHQIDVYSIFFTHIAADFSQNDAPVYTEHAPDMTFKTRRVAAVTAAPNMLNLYV